jgi:hypothetical protein
MKTQMEKSQRSVSEIIERARPVIHDRYVRRLIDEYGLLPTPVHTIVHQNTHGDETTKTMRAKAARWLAVLRRDYPEEYEKLIAENQQEATNP